MPLPDQPPRSKKWPWWRTLILFAVLLGLLILTLLPDRADHREREGAAADAGGSSLSDQEPASEERRRGDPSRAALPSAGDPTAPSALQGPATRSGEARRDGASAPGDLPIWERPPRTTIQPFPPEAAFDPPLPPFKVPPEMIGQPSGTVAPVGAVDASPPPPAASAPADSDGGQGQSDQNRGSR
jgi:hypothetical protein